MTVLVFFDDKDMRRTALTNQELVLAKDHRGEKSGGLETFAFGAQVPVQEQGIHIFDEGAQRGSCCTGGLVVSVGEAFEQLDLAIVVERCCPREGQVKEKLIALARTCSFSGRCGKMQAGKRIGDIFSVAAVEREEVEIGSH